MSGKNGGVGFEIGRKVKRLLLDPGKSSSGALRRDRKTTAKGQKFLEREFNEREKEREDNKSEETEEEEKQSIEGRERRYKE